MFYLNENQIEIVRSEVMSQDIHVGHLADDFIDHICCDIEEEIWKGATFENAYKIVLKKMQNNLLRNIQNDTLYLIDKKYRIMKKSIKITGIVSLILMSFGTLFKIQHWPGASILLVLGFGTLALVFFPSAVSALWIESKMRSRKLLNIAGTLGGVLLITGVLFKIQHWPGSSIMLIVGYNFFALVFIPVFVISKLLEKDKTQSRALYIIGGMSFIFILEGSLFKILHLPGAGILLILGPVLLTAVCIPIYYFQHYSKTGYVKSSFIFLCVGVILFNTFSMLIAINVSRNVLSDFVRPGDILMEGGRCAEEKNAVLSKLISNDSTFNLKQQLNDVIETSDKASSIIRKIKSRLVSLCTGKTISPDEADEISCSKLNNIDNTGFAQIVFKEENNGEKLTAALENLRRSISSLSSVSPIAKSIASGILNTDSSLTNYGYKEPWIDRFVEKPAIASINFLSLTQRQVEFAKYEALKLLLLYGKKENI